MPKNLSLRSSKGFSLIELLVVIAIIAILTSLGVTSFTTAQKKGRDTQRKSDLKTIQSALQLYYADNNAFPVESAGAISCGAWGSAMTCSGRTYLGQVPNDPVAGRNYNYKTAACGTTCQNYTLWADLEMDNDPDRNGGTDTSCTSLPGSGDICVHPNQ
jgi:type II secretion system protein G